MVEAMVVVIVVVDEGGEANELGGGRNPSSFMRHLSRHNQGLQQTEMDGVQACFGPQGTSPPVQQVAAASSVLPFVECLWVEVVVCSPMTPDVQKLARTQRHQARAVDYQRARPPSRLQLLQTVPMLIMAGG